MPTLLAPVAIQQFKDSNGNPLVGGQLYTYAAGTSTPQASYTDATGTSANSNPVILNSRGEAPLWLTPGQFYKLVLMDASNVLIWSSDQVPGGFVDSSLLPDTASSNKVRTDLLALTGATLIGANAYQKQDAINKEHVSVRRFGCIGVIDDTFNFQTAVNYAATTGCILNISEGTYRLTAPIVSATGYRLRGCAVQPYQGAIGTLGVGAWLFFDHTGVGLNTGSTVLSSGFEVKDIGTRRNQPIPAAGWAPNPHDFDIKINNCDSYLENIMLLNATKGVFLDNGNAGRLSFRRLRGQCFQIGLQIETSYDVISGDHMHLWPFWANDTNVNAYTNQNLDAIYLKRCDNPKLTNIFTIFAHSSIRFGQNANGCTSKIKVSNMDSDRGMLGIWIDPTVTNGASGQFSNISHQGEVGLIGSKMIHVQGNNSSMDFVNIRTDVCNQNGIRIYGTGNLMRFAHLSIYTFDQAVGNFPAIELGAGNRAEILGKPVIGTAGGNGDHFSSTGIIICDEWRAFIPVVTSQTGSITSYTSYGRFKIVGQTVSVKASITITAAGTGGGALQFSIPSGTTLYDSPGSGRESAVAGKSLQLLASGTLVSIFNYDNTYPGVTGAILNVDFSYIITV